MKEIGARLKEAREDMGVSIEEAAADLKLRVSQLENIESGNLDAFKDVYYLKYFIRDYAKYLGLNYEDMIDEFNEYLFDYTSKISIDDIKKAKKKLNKKQPKKEEEKRIASPYTLEHHSKFKVSPIVFYLCIAVVVFLASYFIFSNLDNAEEPETNDLVAYSIID